MPILLIMLGKVILGLFVAVISAVVFGIAVLFYTAMTEVYDIEYYNEGDPIDGIKLVLSEWRVDVFIALTALGVLLWVSKAPPIWLLLYTPAVLFDAVLLLGIYRSNYACGLIPAEPGVAETDKIVVVSTPQLLEKLPNVYRAMLIAVALGYPLGAVFFGM